MIIETGVFLLSLGIVLLIETAVSIAASTGKWPSLTMVLLARLVEIGSLTVILACRKAGLEVIGLSSDKCFSGIKRGLVWSALLGLSALTGYFILRLFGINPVQMIKVFLPKELRARLLFFIAGGLMAPVAEELFFRGIIYGFLRRWGIIFALVGSTVLFVLPHSTGGAVPVVQIVGGLVFAISYEVEKNLMVPITVHVLGNISLFSLSLVT